MNIKETNGITLIALVITIILLLILGGVVINQLSSGNLIGNAMSVADKSKIASKKEEIQLAITSKMIEAEGDITIEDIISKLEKNGIIDSGNSNSENGQVKTNPDGYIYEIVQDANGNWNVNYVGKGEIEATKITLATSVDTTSITNKVTITATAKAQSGIKSIQLPDGTSKTYTSGTTTATATYEVTQNGTYKFTATNNNNESIDKTVAISNILEGEIAIVINPSTPTNKDVTAIITWPSGNYSATKEVSTNGGTTYTAVTGTTTQINITANCNIRARIKTASGEIKTQTYEITNIDKTNPTVTARQSSLTITEGDSNELSGYFDVVANGKYGISSIVYTDTSNNDAVITNTNTLVVGTHIIKCTATKETGATASATVTIVVKRLVTISEIVNNPTEYYGKYVNYTVPEGGDPNVKWQIFYADDENIYLIADDYIEYNYAPIKKVDETEYMVNKMTDNEKNYQLAFTDIINAYNGITDITDSRIKKWLRLIEECTEEYVQDSGQLKALAYLLDISIWNEKYKNDYADYTIGGPTIELFNASYNVIHPQKYIEEQIKLLAKRSSGSLSIGRERGNGYILKWNTDSDYSTGYLSDLDTTEYNNLYVINTNSKAEAYRIASPYYSWSICLTEVQYNGTIYGSDYRSQQKVYGGCNTGMRPIICLKANIKLSENNNDTYDLKE